MKALQATVQAGEDPGPAIRLGAQLPRDKAAAQAAQQLPIPLLKEEDVQKQQQTGGEEGESGVKGRRAQGAGASP